MAPKLIACQPFVALFSCPVSPIGFFSLSLWMMSCCSLPMLELGAEFGVSYFYGGTVWWDVRGRFDTSSGLVGHFWLAWQSAWTIPWWQNFKTLWRHYSHWKPRNLGNLMNAQISIRLAGGMYPRLLHCIVCLLGRLPLPVITMENIPQTVLFSHLYRLTQKPLIHIFVEWPTPNPQSKTFARIVLDTSKIELFPVD